MILMTICRLSKDNFSITCSGYTFTAIKRCFSDHWYVECEALRIHKLCDDLSEVFDYIDFIFS